MIPNVLISKYLDGELSIEEDMEFRTLLAADSEAREAFDSAVLLHIAMRCEDDTTVPADVEERVLAFIDTVPMYAQNVTMQRSIRTSPVKGLRARGRATRRVLAIAAMLLVLALPFGDQFLTVGDDLVDSSTTSTPSTPSTTSTPSTLSTPHTPSTTTADARSAARVVQSVRTIVPSLAAEPVLVSDGLENLSDKADVHHVVVDNQEQTVPPSLHSLFATKDIPVFVNNRGPEPRTTTLTTDAPNIDVLVSTSFSQSFASPTAGAVTTIAAGIGYAVTSNTFVGMEMGSTQYTRTNETSGLVTDNSAAALADARGTGSKQSDHSGQLAKVTIESNTGPRYRTEIHSSLSPEGTIWGAAFVQHSVLRTGILALNGRLGAGVGEDGMLTYGRMQAECALFSGVSLTIGAEARYTPFRTGVVGGQPMARTYGTVISALYGLQVRL